MQNPRRLNLAVTSACNCRCQMCSIWEQKAAGSLSLDQYRELFRSRSLSKVSQLSLTGGEPTLRADLQELVGLAVAAFPRLVQLSLNSNGFSPALLEQQVVKILAVQGKKSQLSVGLSFDGIGEVHDRIRGVPDAFSRLSESITRLEALRKTGLNFGLSLRCTITKDNVHQLREIDSYCCQRGWPIIFAVASDPDAFINAEQKRDLFALDQAQLAACQDFFLEKAPDHPYYARAADFLAQRRRTFGCIGAEGYAVLVLPNGDVMPCGERAQLLLGNLNEQAFDEIWSGEQARKVFASMRQEACAVCPSQCYPAEQSWRDDFRPFVKSLLPAPLVQSLRQLKRTVRTGKK